MFRHNAANRVYQVQADVDDIGDDRDDNGRAVIQNTARSSRRALDDDDSVEQAMQAIAQHLAQAKAVLHIHLAAPISSLLKEQLVQLSTLLQTIQLLLIGKFVIAPGSAFKYYWDWVVLISAAYICIIIPWEIVFLPGSAETLEAFDLLSYVLIGCDILLTFRTGFVHYDGHPVHDAKLIARRYMAGRFWWDVVSCIPFYPIINGISPAGLDRRQLNYCKLNNMLRVYRLFTNDLLNFNSPYLRIAKLFAGFLYLAHCFACCLFYVALNESLDDSFVALTPGMHQAYSSQAEIQEYVSTLYYVLTTMATVGYGDISAQTSAEQIVVIPILMSAALIYASIFSNIRENIQSITSTSRRYQETIDGVREYCSANGMQTTATSNTSELQKQSEAASKSTTAEAKLGIKLQHYALEEWNYNKGFDMQRVLTALPTSVRSDVMTYLYKPLLKSVPLFRNCSVAFFRTIVLRLHTQICLAGDYIYHEGDKSRDLYFIRDGSVDVLTEDPISGRTLMIASLASDSPEPFFGEIALLLGERRTASVRAKASKCVFATLSQADFFDVLEMFPEEENTLRETAMQRLQADMDRVAQAEMDKEQRQARQRGVMQANWQLSKAGSDQPESGIGVTSQAQMLLSAPNSISQPPSTIELSTAAPLHALTPAAAMLLPPPRAAKKGDAFMNLMRMAIANKKRILELQAQQGKDIEASAADDASVAEELLEHTPDGSVPNVQQSSDDNDVHPAQLADTHTVPDTAAETVPPLSRLASAALPAALAGQLLISRPTTADGRQLHTSIPTADLQLISHMHRGRGALLGSPDNEYTAPPPLLSSVGSRAPSLEQLRSFSSMDFNAAQRLEAAAEAVRVVAQTQQVDGSALQGHSKSDMLSAIPVNVSVMRVVTASLQPTWLPGSLEEHVAGTAGDAPTDHLLSPGQWIRPLVSSRRATAADPLASSLVGPSNRRRTQQLTATAKLQLVQQLNHPSATEPHHRLDDIATPTLSHMQSVLQQHSRSNTLGDSLAELPVTASRRSTHRRTMTSNRADDKRTILPPAISVLPVPESDSAVEAADQRRTRNRRRHQTSTAAERALMLGALSANQQLIVSAHHLRASSAAAAGVDRLTSNASEQLDTERIAAAALEPPQAGELATITINMHDAASTTDTSEPSPTVESLAAASPSPPSDSVCRTHTDTGLPSISNNSSPSSDLFTARRGVTVMEFLDAVYRWRVKRFLRIQQHQATCGYTQQHQRLGAVETMATEIDHKLDRLIAALQAEQVSTDHPASVQLHG